jgi:hypothetical protein
MNYDDIIQYLQGLTGSKQNQQNSQFGQNIGLQQQQLAQQGSQFGQNIALQQQQLEQQGSQFDKNLGFQNQQLAQSGSQFDKNLGFQNQQLAQSGGQFDKTFGLTAEQQKFQQEMMRRQAADDEFNNAVAQSKAQPSWQATHPVFQAAPAPSMFGAPGQNQDYSSGLMQYLQAISAANPSFKFGGR